MIKTIYKALKSLFLGRYLDNSIKKLFDEAPNIKRVTLAEVSSAIILRLTRIGAFAFFIGIIPYIFLYQQNKLIEKQNKYLVETNKPNLGVKGTFATFTKEKDTYTIESNVVILNYGKREAKNININYYVYEINDDKCTMKEPKKYSPSNPTFPDQEVDYPIIFKTNYFESNIYLKLELRFYDDLLERETLTILHYRYPTINQLNQNKQKRLGLFMAEKGEIININNCFSN